MFSSTKGNSIWTPEAINLVKTRKTHSFCYFSISTIALRPAPCRDWGMKLQGNTSDIVFTKKSDLASSSNHLWNIGIFWHCSRNKCKNLLQLIICFTFEKCIDRLTWINDASFLIGQSGSGSWINVHTDLFFLLTTS